MGSLPPRKYKTFLNDKDGLSSRDYLLLLSTSVFFIFIAIGLVLVLMDTQIDAMYLSLLDMVSPVVMTIVGSVAGIDITDKITKRKVAKQPTQDEAKPDPIVYEDGYISEEDYR